MIIGNNPKLDLVGNDVLTIFGESLQIASEDIERRKTLKSVKGCDSVKILRTMTGINHEVDIVNYDVLTKFSQILSINSEKKKTSDVSQGL